MKFNSITIAPVASLEVGDVIAHGFLGGVISGKVTGVIYASYQLNAEQKSYMINLGLDIPANEYEAIAGESSVLVFGNFKGEGINKDQPDHMYLELTVNVAVFPNN